MARRGPKPKPVEDRRVERLSLRLTSAALQALESIAQRGAATRSATIEALILEAVQRGKAGRP